MLAAATELQRKQRQASGTGQLPTVQPKARQRKRVSDGDDAAQQTPPPKRSLHQTDTPDAAAKAKPTKRARRALAQSHSPAEQPAEDVQAVAEAAQMQPPLAKANPSKRRRNAPGHSNLPTEQIAASAQDPQPPADVTPKAKLRRARAQSNISAGRSSSSAAQPQAVKAKTAGPQLQDPQPPADVIPKAKPRRARSQSNISAGRSSSSAAQPQVPKAKAAGLQPKGCARKRASSSEQPASAARRRQTRRSTEAASIGNPAFDNLLHEIRELAAELQKLKEFSWIVDEDEDALNDLLEQIDDFQQFPVPWRVLCKPMIRKLYQPVCGSPRIRIGQEFLLQDLIFVSNVTLSMWQVSVYLAVIL